MAQKKLPSKEARNKEGSYALIQKFPGYHAREDKTMLDPSYMVSPSQNVVIKTSGRISLVKGYTLDGSGSTIADSGILSSYDFTNFKGDVRNMRAGFLTSAANDGKLQYRYVASGLTTVNWVDLMTSLTNVRLAFTSYWDNSALVRLMLWVDGSNNVYAWNGAVTTVASATANKAINITGSSASLTAYSAPTGTASVIQGSNGAVGTSLLAYVGLTTQPTNGQTLILNINATPISIQFVSVIGAAAGNVLIGVDLSTTMTNLLGLLNAPGTTNANQVALSGANQTIIAYSTYASVLNTLTKQDSTKTWAQEGFAQTGGSRAVTVGGVSYTYSGGEYSTTLVGVSADLSATVAGAIVHQTPVTTALSAMSAILSTFGPTVIGCGRRNQVYLGSNLSSQIYISKVNSYTDYTFTSPTRVVGEGALIPLDAPPTVFIPMEVRTDTSAYDMYISQGTDNWSIIRATLSSDLTKETLENIRMKVAPLQGAKSARLATKMKNHIMFVGNDNVADFLGYLSYEYVPELVDFSYPIIDDMVGYDFTDASIFYHRNYVYIAVPKSGLIRVYNMTNQQKEDTSSIRGIEDVDVANQPWFWEAPITYPVSGFYVVSGELYGHSYVSSESYKLFTTGQFNGQQIEANATFSYDAKGDRTQTKLGSELWVDGYLAQNTILNGVVAGDLDSFRTEQNVTINGNDSTIVGYGSGAHALGKNTLGSSPLGGAQTLSGALPAYFHVAKEYPPLSFYLEQITFYTKGLDLAWELLSFGTNADFTAEGNNDITQ